MAAPACQDCGAPLRSTVARGLCPRCVVRAALTPESTAAVDELNEAGSARRFGAYELGRELGRGGMGVVYEARQLSLHRIVALKMLLPARLASVEELERFRFEAEGVAALEHPNILPVYEVGTAQGQPYFTMKLADGGSLAEQLQDKRLTAAEAARLLATVSHAVHHAHQRGIQHRDLKPGNILLDAAGRPYVSDFGLAKFRDRDSGLTLSTTVLGSPAYMSPEQASGDARRVTVASDVYSLGAILYESLAGRPPFAGATALETMRQVVEAEPTPLRELVARVDRDLEVICLKCLQKDPAKRYASAEVLARDLERWLAGDPIQARPVSRGERFVRWCRRRPALTASLAALFLALIAGIAGIAVQWRRAEEHSFRSALERYAADMQVASQALANHDVGLARRMIAAQMPAPSQPDFRGFEWRLLAKLSEGQELRTLTGHGGTVTAVAFSPDGQFAVSGAMDGSVRLWNVSDGTLRKRISAHGVPWSVLFTPDGERIITSGMDGQVRFWSREGEPAEAPLPGQCAALSGDGSRLAVSDSSAFKYFGAKPGVRVWDWRARKLIFTTNVAVRRVALSADGKWLAGAGAHRDLLVWNLDTGAMRRFPTTDALWALTFSPDAARIAASGFNVGARVWDLHSTNQPIALSGHQFKIWGIAFSPDGERIATSGSDRTVQIHQLGSLDQRAVLKGHDDEVWWVAWSPDGRRLLTASKDMTLRLWPDEPARAEVEVPNNKNVLPLFSRDGQRLLTVHAPGAVPRVVLREAKSGAALHEFAHRFAAAFTPGGDVLLLNGPRASLERWSPETKNIAAEIALGEIPAPFKTAAFAFSEDALAFAAAGDRHVHVWRTDTGARLITPLPLAGSRAQLALAPRGRYLAIGYASPYLVELYDLGSGRRLALTNHTEEVKGVTFSPDGKLLASASIDRFVRLWNTHNGQPHAEFVRHIEEATGVAFSADGETLASIGTEQAVKLWHLPSGREVVSLPAPEAGDRVTFSPAGDALAFTTVSNTVRVLLVPPLR